MTRLLLAVVFLALPALAPAANIVLTFPLAFHPCLPLADGIGVTCTVETVPGSGRGTFGCIYDPEYYGYPPGTPRKDYGTQAPNTILGVLDCDGRPGFLTGCDRNAVSVVLYDNGERAYRVDQHCEYDPAVGYPP